MPTNYTYISGKDLTPEERYALSTLRGITAKLRDENPEELEDFLGGYISLNESLSDLSTNRVTAYMIKAFEAASKEDDSLEDFDFDFKEKFPVSSQKTGAEFLNSYMENDITPMDFSGYNIGGEDDYVEGCTDPAAWNWDVLATEDDGSCEYIDGGDGNCDCVAACEGFNTYSDCYTSCGCSSPYTPPEGGGWTLPDLGSTLGNILTGIGSVIQDIGEEIGWGNIFNSFMNTNDNGESDDAPDDDDDEDDDEDTNWGKVALYSVLGIGVVVGGYFLIKKLRK